MSALSNVKWELFCRHLATGLSQRKAFAAAGYSKTSLANACTLAKRPEIVERVAELLEEKEIAAGTHRETNEDELAAIEAAGHASKAWVTSRLCRVAMNASAARDWNGATRALEVLGRSIGMFVDKAPVDPDEFRRRDGRPLITVDDVNRLLAGVGLDTTIKTGGRPS